MLIYDGECAFCIKAASWAQSRLQICVQPWQALDLGPLGLTEGQCRHSVQWAQTVTAPKSGGAAVTEALQHGPGVWPYLGATLSTPALAPVLEVAYRFVADRRRHLSRYLMQHSA